MATATDILVGTGTVVGIVWLAAFICALCDRLSGTDREDDTEDEKAVGESVKWWSWKGIVLLPIMPLVLLIMTAMAVLLAPPMLRVDVIWPKRPRPSDGAGRGDAD